MAWKALLSSFAFGCLENTASPIGVVGVPLDSSCTYRPGSRFAPQQIRNAACNIELYSALADLSLENVGFIDYGDIMIPPGDIHSSLRTIELVVKNIANEHRGLLVVLGGEHLVTYPVLRTLLNKIDTLVVFDAHLDTRPEYMGSKLNHATFLRRLTEETRDLKVIHIGSRAYSEGELEYAAKSGIALFRAFDVLHNAVKLGDLGRVYISVDMDVFDPSIAPGVSNPEPFGINHFTFAHILKEIFERSSDVVGLDIVEVNPLVDSGDITSVLAAKIVLEASGLYLKKKGSSTVPVG